MPGLRYARFVPAIASTLAAAAPHLVLQLYDVRGSLPPLDGQPSADEIDQLELVVVAMARVCGVAAAWNACRTVFAAQPAHSADSLRQHLLGALLRYCFVPAAPDAVREFLILPLARDEELFVESFALRETVPLPSAAIVMDALLVKLINEGRYVDAIHLDRRAAQHERSHAFVPQEDAAVSARLRQRRRMLIDGLWAILPPVQRDAFRVHESAPDEPAPIDEELSAPPERPRTPMSASLGAGTSPTAKASSSDARLLRTSIRATSLRNSAADAQVSASALARSSAAEHHSPALRSSSPFAGWKRPTSTPPPAAPRASDPAWGVPVPSHSRDVSMETPTHASSVAATAAAIDVPMDELGAAPSGSVGAADDWVAPAPDESMPAPEDLSSTAAALPDVPAESTPAKPTEGKNEDESEQPTRRRGGRRRAAQKASAALRESLRPAELVVESEPVLPGGFPMETEAEAEPRHAPRTRRARGAMPAAEASLYPQQSLERLQSLGDTRPIARRTRARTAGATKGDVSDAADAEVPQPRRRSTRDASPVASTPQRGARSTRRLRDGSAATPGTRRRA